MMDPRIEIMILRSKMRTARIKVGKPENQNGMHWNQNASQLESNSMVLESIRESVRMKNGVAWNENVSC